MKKQNDLETTGEGNIVRQDGFSEPEKTETGAGLVGRVRPIYLNEQVKNYFKEQKIIIEMAEKFLKILR